MAKTSLKVKQSSRAKYISVREFKKTQDAKDVEDLMVFYVNSDYAVFVLENLLTKEKFLVLKSQVGRKEVKTW